MTAFTTYRRSRARRIALPVVAALLAALFVGFLVLSSSRAVFTSATSNSGNSVSTGTVDLVDDDSGSVMFNISGMVPGDSYTRCIRVTYQGTVANPSAVKLYSGGYTDSGTLDDYLNITVDEGTGGVFGNCTGFTLQNTIEPTGTLATFGTSHTSYATGAGVWDPSSTPESKTYRITLALPVSTPDSQQGKSITALIFTWEVQS